MWVSRIIVTPQTQMISLSFLNSFKNRDDEHCWKSLSTPQDNNNMYWQQSQTEILRDETTSAHGDDSGILYFNPFNANDILVIFEGV